MVGLGISGYYNVLLVLHILTAIIGLGAVMLNGLYASQALRRPGPAGRAVSEANYAVSSIGEYFIYAIPVFGILLVLASHHAWKFSQTWIWLSLLLYVFAIGISHSILIPGHRKINALLADMEQGPPPTAGPPTTRLLASRQRPESLPRRRGKRRPSCPRKLLRLRR